jgi:molybdenum cofactor cytidylyltransferase
MNANACAAILLAAGASSRLGYPKQLVECRGESLLHRSARLAGEVGCRPVICVLGFEPARMRAELEGTTAVATENPLWATGMASSLVCGVRAVMNRPDPPANVLVLVCDQVRLDADVLRRLLTAHAASTNPITAAEYSGRAGVPAVFSAEIFPELMALTGDRGARAVIAARLERVTKVPWPDGAIDLDSPEDAHLLRLPGL